MDKVLRILDANLNRGREGLRVVEDLVRFVLDDAALSSQIKATRHEITTISREILIQEKEILYSRNSSGDVGMDIKSDTELSRISLAQIATANIRRSQESMRVLEELSKLYDTNTALRFKKLRYKLYELEKQVFMKLLEAKSDMEFKSQDGC